MQGDECSLHVVQVKKSLNILVHAFNNVEMSTRTGCGVFFYAHEGLDTLSSSH